MKNFLLTCVLENPYFENQTTSLFISSNVFANEQCYEIPVKDLKYIKENKTELKYFKHESSPIPIEHGINFCKEIIRNIIDKNKVDYIPDQFSESENVLLVRELLITAKFHEKIDIKKFRETINSQIEEINSKYNSRTVSRIPPFQKDFVTINELSISAIITNKRSK